MSGHIDIQKNAREVIRVERQDFKGHDLLNLRVFYAGDDGEMRPGRQGLAIRSELATDLIEAIQEVAVGISAR